MQSALAAVNDVVQVIEAWVVDQLNANEFTEDDDQAVEISQFCDNLTECIQAAESIEFPRMT